MLKFVCYFRFALAIGFLWWAVCAQADVTLTVKESDMVELLPGLNAYSLTVSADSNHVAYEAQQGDKRLVVVDGKPGPAYDGIRGRFARIQPG